MGRLITYLEDRHPRKERCRHEQFKEFYDKKGVNFGKKNTRVDLHTIKGAKKRHLIEIFRLDQFIEQLYEDNANHPKKLDVLRQRGCDIQKKLTDRIVKIDGIDEVHSLEEIRCVKALSTYWKSLRDIVREYDLYTLGYEIYANHRWAIEKTKSNKELSLKKAEVEINDYDTISKLKYFIQVNDDFRVDIVKEQRKYVNREFDISRRAKIDHKYDPNRDFLLLESELLHELGRIAQDPSAKELAVRKGYSPRKKGNKIVFFNDSQKKSRKYSSRRR